MASKTDLDSFLASLGFDQNKAYDVPNDPSEAALAGIDAFLREHGLDGVAIKETHCPHP